MRSQRRPLRLALPATLLGVALALQAAAERERPAPAAALAAVPAATTDPAADAAATATTATTTPATPPAADDADLARLAAIAGHVTRDLVGHGRRWVEQVMAPWTRHPAPPDVSALEVEPVKGIESSGYGWREDPINYSRKFHKGADYRADRGTPVYAAGGGVVAFHGRQRGYGKVIYLDHGGGLITRYAHLSAIGVELGQVVAADERIGAVGSTGRTTGPHLHFEVRVDGRAVDPVLALQVAAIQRTQPGPLAHAAAMGLLPDAQRGAVDRHSPHVRRQQQREQRSDRSGRSGSRTSRRDRPTS